MQGSTPPRSRSVSRGSNTSPDNKLPPKEISDLVGLCVDRGRRSSANADDISNTLMAYADLLNSLMSGYPLPAYVPQTYTVLGTVDEHVETLLAVVKGLSDSGCPELAMQLLVHLMQQFPVPRIGMAVKQVKCLVSVLQHCEAGLPVPDGVWQHLESLQVFGVIHERLMQECADAVQLCTLSGAASEDEIAQAEARAIACIVRSVEKVGGELTPECERATELLTTLFQSACTDGRADVIGLCLKLLGNNLDAKELASALKTRWAEQQPLLTMQDATQRMNEAGWVLSTHNTSEAGGSIRCEWILQEGRTVDVGALQYFVETAVKCGDAVMPGVLDATLDALQKTGWMPIDVANMLMTMEDCPPVRVLQFIEQALSAGEFDDEHCSAADVVPVREWLVGCVPGSSDLDREQVEKRAFGAWQELVTRSEDVWPAMYYEAKLWSKRRIGANALEDLRLHVKQKDPFAEVLYRELGLDPSFSVSVMGALQNASPERRTSGTRRHLLGEHFRRELKWEQATRYDWDQLTSVPRMSLLHTVAACFPDEDASVAAYAAVMSEGYNDLGLRKASLAQWLAVAAEPERGWERQWCNAGMEPGARRLDLLLLGILRMAALSGERGGLQGLGAQAESAFRRHANIRYRALCSAAALVEFLECCPRPPKKLVQAWREQAERLLGRWRAERSSRPLPIAETECDAWAGRLAGRLEALKLKRSNS